MESYNVHSSMRFATVGTVSRSDRTMTEARVFVPADEVQLEFIPGASASSLPVPPKTHSKDAVTAEYQMTQLHPS